jgi:hypothetical protein
MRARFAVPADQEPATPEADFCNLMQFRKISNRITRFYYYNLTGNRLGDTGQGFDSALVDLGPNGEPIPRVPQYETYRFYTSPDGSQQC